MQSVNSQRAAFYKSLFPNLQQKNASTQLTILWGSDPFKAKWAVIAAAYSSVRDAVGKPRAPLEIFLKIVCPSVGIFGVDEYLHKLNWICEFDGDGAVSLNQTADPAFRAFESGTLTETDVVQLCAE